MMDSDLPKGIVLTVPGYTLVAEVPPEFGRPIKMEVRGDRLLIETDKHEHMIISCRIGKV